MFFWYQRKVSRNPATKDFNEDHAHEILAAKDMMIYAPHSLPNSKRTICKNKKAAHMELNKSIAAASFQTPGAYQRASTLQQHMAQGRY